VRAKELPHFGWSAEMIIAVQTFFGMLLAKQREGADTLDDVVFPAVSGQFVVDRE